MMNKSSAALWGFAGTVVLTTLMSGSQALGITRMNLPYILEVRPKSAEPVKRIRA